MSSYTEQVLNALTAFDTTLAGFGALVRTRPTSATVLRKDLDRLTEWANRAGAAASQLRFSSNIIVDTAVDIVDFQVRLQGEAAALASALGGLASVLEKQPAIRDAFEDAVVSLDEAAQGVASALFPGAVEGLGDVNVALWDFDRVLWREYTTRFRDAVRDGDLTFDQQSRIQAIANEVHQAFDDVNALLNALAENAIPGGPAISRALAAARAALLRSVDNASKKLTKPYADFAPFVERAGRIARKVDKLLDKLRIPVFPAHADLGVLGPCIAPALVRLARRRPALRPPEHRVATAGDHGERPRPARSGLRREGHARLPRPHLPERRPRADRRHRRRRRAVLARAGRAPSLPGRQLQGAPRPRRQPAGQLRHQRGRRTGRRRRRHRPLSRSVPAPVRRSAGQSPDRTDHRPVQRAGRSWPRSRLPPIGGFTLLAA